MSGALAVPVADAPHKEPMIGNEPTVLTDVYRDETNIVVWQRELGEPLTRAAHQVIAANPTLKASVTVTPDSVYRAVNDVLGTTQAAAILSQDIAQLVDMFCCLFELKRVGLRVTALDRAMCPRFHVDRVPCRLVTTYCGSATQWLPHHLVDRNKLGMGNQGQPDEQSGLFARTSDIHQLTQGDVALLKGELWQGNEGAGLVHRSPPASNGASRLLLTLDFVGD